MWIFLKKNIILLVIFILLIYGLELQDIGKKSATLPQKPFETYNMGLRKRNSCSVNWSLNKAWTTQCKMKLNLSSHTYRRLIGIKKIGVSFI